MRNLIDSGLLINLFERNLAFGKDDSLTSDFLARFERFILESEPEMSQSG